MNRFKRGLAILLSTCMIGGMMPLPASAEETVSENIVQTECIENTENLENAPSEDEKSSETDHETGSETESETVTDAETKAQQYQRYRHLSTHSRMQTALPRTM